LADMRIETLRGIRVEAVRRAHEERSVRRELDPDDVPARRLPPRIRREDLFDVVQPIAVEAAARDRRGRPVAVAAVGPRRPLQVRDVNEAIRLETGMQRDVEELIERERRKISRGFGLEPTVAQQPDAPAAL